MYDQFDIMINKNKIKTNNTIDRKRRVLKFHIQFIGSKSQYNNWYINANKLHLKFKK